MSLEFQNVLIIMSVRFLQQKYIPLQNIQTPLSSETDLTLPSMCCSWMFLIKVSYAAFLIEGTTLN